MTAWMRGDRGGRGLRALLAAGAVAAAWLSAAEVAAQDRVTGATVREVAVDGGFFRQRDDGTWLHRTANQRRILREIQRDEWSVFLQGPDSILQLDLFTLEYRTYQGAVISAITASSAKVCEAHQAARTEDKTAVHNMVMTYDQNAADDEARFRFAVPTFRIDPTLRTYILIHGFQSNPGNAFDAETRTLLLGRTANVLTVDYRSLFLGSALVGPAKTLEEYDYAYRRAWNVGWKLSELMQEELCVDPAQVELVANSLGGVVAASAADDYFKDTGNRLDRIVGLDSVGQYMSGLGADVRLTKDDATRVIGIHSSDARQFGSCNNQAVGWFDNYGHLDIYIYTNRHGTAVDDVKQLLGSGAGCYRNDHQHNKEIYKALLRGDSFDYAPSLTWDESEMTFTGFSYDWLGTMTGSVTLHEEGAGTAAGASTDTCPAFTETGRATARNQVQFVLPAGTAGQEIVIPEGASARYVFPQCYRVWWHRQIYSCRNGAWTHVSGQRGDDGLCHGSIPASANIRVSDR